MHVPYFALILLTFVIPFFLLNLGNNPDSPLSQLNNPAHVAFFATLAWTLTKIPKLKQLNFARQSLVIIIIAIVVGGMIELVQPYFARTASWQDMGINLLGAIAGLYLLPNRHKKRSRAYHGAQIFIVASLSYFLFYKPIATIWDMNSAKRQFPIIGDFESYFESWRWTNGYIDHSLARQGNASLRVQLDGEPYPGTTLLRSFGNWENHESFAISVYNPKNHPVNINISIRDSDHDQNKKGFGDRYDETFTLRSGWTDLMIPLEKISDAPKERKLSLNKISSVVIFFIQKEDIEHFNIDNIRLVK